MSTQTQTTHEVLPAPTEAIATLANHGPELFITAEALNDSTRQAIDGLYERMRARPGFYRRDLQRFMTEGNRGRKPDPNWSYLVINPSTRRLCQFDANTEAAIRRNKKCQEIDDGGRGPVKREWYAQRLYVFLDRLIQYQRQQTKLGQTALAKAA